jgi:hypothetical protein
MYTSRQYRPHQKLDFLNSFPAESKAAADHLGPDLKELTFRFATVFRDKRDGLVGVRIEFASNEGCPVWVDVMAEGAKKVLDGRAPTGAGPAGCPPSR